MHCISAYPAELEEARLDNIRILRETFGVHVGYSDYDWGSEAELFSIHFGATMTEKHFILSREVGGVDSKFSLNKEELTEWKKLTSAVSAVERLEEFERSPGEQESLKFRRSLYFARDIRAGEVIKEGDIRRARPGFCLAPRYVCLLIGKRLTFEFRIGDPVTTELQDSHLGN